MKKLFVLLFSLFTFYSSLFSQSPNWLWAKGIGGTGIDVAYSITLDANRNVYCTGWFTGTVDFDPGPAVFNLTSSGAVGSGYEEVFISKFDNSGNFIWAKSFGGPGDDYGYSVAVDASDNIYITGSFTGTADFDPGAGVFNLTSTGGNDVFISKLDSSGNFIWAKAIGGSLNDVGYSVALDASDNIYLTGLFTGTVDFDPGAATLNLTSNGGIDIFISKLDSAGNLVWAKTMGGPSGDYSYLIKVDSSENIYTTGYFQYTVDFDPDTGVFNLTSSGGTDIFISKLDSSGNFIWAKAMGGPGNDYGQSLAVDASGNVFTTGFFSGTADFDPGTGTFNLTSVGVDNLFISKLNNSGNFVWAKGMGGVGNNTEGRSIAVDADDNVYTAGAFSGTTDFNPDSGSLNLTSAGSIDLFISKLDSSGNYVFATKVGGTTFDGGCCLALDTSGNIYVAGYYYSSSISFGSDTLINANNTGNTSDCFLSKLSHTVTVTINPNACNSYLSPSGNYVWTSSGTYYDTIPGSGGSDSVITVNLTIHHSTASSQVVASCNNYISQDGNNTWTASGTYVDTIPNALGCDSIITTHLTINNVDTSLTLNGITLTANDTGAMYQWLNCNAGFAVIVNDTSQVFSATGNGNYAVAITRSGCTDTSACYMITGVGIAETNLEDNNKLFPNPATNYLYIDMAGGEEVEVSISDITGKVIFITTFYPKQEIEISTKELTDGVYFVCFKTKDFIEVKKLVIKN